MASPPSSNAKWFSTITIPVLKPRLEFDDHLVSTGSCFAEHISERLQTHGMQVVQDPFGPLYHPLPMAALLERALLSDAGFSPDDCTFSEATGHWHLLAVHGRYADQDQDAVLQQANTQLLAWRQALRQATSMLCSFGTADAYFHGSQPEQAVGNCHRIPANNFSKRRSSLSELSQRWDDLLSRIGRQYPRLRLIFSVSPIRYGGLDPHTNSCSKATLHLLIDALLQQHQQHWYFPAYELWMDELRDYRFYAADRKHPSDEAIDYAWQRFCEAAISSDTCTGMEAVGKVLRQLAHRPRHNSDQHGLQSQIAALQAQYPKARLDHLRDALMTRLHQQ